MHPAEFAALDFAPPLVAVEGSPESGFLFFSTQPLQAYRENLGQMLRHWGGQTPERIFRADRQADGQWLRLSYAEVNRRADANEITDKGYINQRASLERRRVPVEQPYAEPPGTGVILL
jgi:hypothetical protein